MNVIHFTTTNCSICPFMSRQHLAARGPDDDALCQCPTANGRMIDVQPELFAPAWCPLRENEVRVTASITMRPQP